MILSPLQRLGRLQSQDLSLATRVRTCWELERCTSPMRCLCSAETTPEQLLPCEQEDDLEIMPPHVGFTACEVPEAQKRLSWWQKFDLWCRKYFSANKEYQ